MIAFVSLSLLCFRLSIHSLHAIVGGQSLASGFPINGTIDEVRDNRNHLVDFSDALIHSVTFTVENKRDETEQPSQ